MPFAKMPLTKNANRIFATVFLVTGLTVQVVAYLWMPDTPLSLVSGMLGICSVVLCSVGNIFTFLFGFAQIITYTYICYLNHLYGNIGINAFYFLSQIYGIYLWRKRGAGMTEAVETRHLKRSVWMLLIGGIAMVSLATGSPCRSSQCLVPRSWGSRRSVRARSLTGAADGWLLSPPA